MIEREYLPPTFLGTKMDLSQRYEFGRQVSDKTVAEDWKDHMLME